MLLLFGELRTLNEKFLFCCDEKLNIFFFRSGHCQHVSIAPWSHIFIERIVRFVFVWIDSIVDCVVTLNQPNAIELFVVFAYREKPFFVCVCTFPSERLMKIKMSTNWPNKRRGEKVEIFFPGNYIYLLTNKVFSGSKRLQTQLLWENAMTMSWNVHWICFRRMNK